MMDHQPLDEAKSSVHFEGMQSIPGSWPLCVPGGEISRPDSAQTT